MIDIAPYFFGTICAVVIWIAINAACGGHWRVPEKF